MHALDTSVPITIREDAHASIFRGMLDEMLSPDGMRTRNMRGRFTTLRLASLPSEQ